MTVPMDEITELQNLATQLRLEAAAADSLVIVAQTNETHYKDLCQRYTEMLEESREREIKLLNKISKARYHLKAGATQAALACLDD